MFHFLPNRKVVWVIMVEWCWWYRGVQTPFSSILGVPFVLGSPVRRISLRWLFSAASRCGCAFHKFFYIFLTWLIPYYIEFDITFFFSSYLCTVDASSTLPIEFVSSILNFFGTVVVLDRMRDAIGEIMLATSFGSVVCAVFCCLVLSRVCDEINGAIGASCPTNSDVFAVFCCLCGGLSSLFFPHEKRWVLYFCVLFGSVKNRIWH